MRIIVWLVLVVLSGCAVSNNPLRKEIKLLRKGIIKDDTSYVYSLPYEKGKAYWMVQGYFSHYTHKERAALDFKMKKGTKIYAARGGIVVRVKEDGDRGGLNKKYRPFGNNIVIQHEDSSRSGYWHLQKDGVVVNVGDTVKQGQLIGYSGKTGYTLFPQLHFQVRGFDENGRWQQLPTRFQTSKGVKYLRSIRKYINKSGTAP